MITSQSVEVGQTWKWVGGAFPPRGIRICKVFELRDFPEDYPCSGPVVMFGRLTDRTSTRFSALETFLREWERA